jgi:hypothetical protein
VAGAILLQNSSLYFVDDSYGIDTDGPIPVYVQVPQSPLHFSDEDIADLKRGVDPCAPSDNYGMDLYEHTLVFVSNFATV